MQIITDINIQKKNFSINSCLLKSGKIQIVSCFIGSKQINKSRWKKVMKPLGIKPTKSHLVRAVKAEILLQKSENKC